MKKTSLRLPEEVWMAARVRALEEGVEFQELVAEALRLYLKQPKKKGGRR